MQKSTMRYCAIAIEDMIRPLEGNDLIRASADVERQGGSESFEIWKVDRKLEPTELSRDRGIVKRVSARTNSTILACSVENPSKSCGICAISIMPIVVSCSRSRGPSRGSCSIERAGSFSWQ